MVPLLAEPKPPWEEFRQRCCLFHSGKLAKCSRQPLLLMAIGRKEVPPVKVTVRLWVVSMATG